MAAPEKQASDKKLLENIQNDLKALAVEARKRYPPLKEAAESGIAKVQNTVAKYKDVRLAFISESPEILEPFFLGCDTKNTKIVQMSLTSIQRLITLEAISSTAASNIITCLWALMESGTEELKLLQTVTLLVTTNSIVQGSVLAKAIVLCFRLHFTKNSTTNNTASATVRQLVSAVFERIAAEDFIPTESLTNQSNIQLEELKAGSRFAPKSLPCYASDGFMLFQDLVQLVNADQPFWLIGLTEMTRTFGLELLESILSSFPDVFFKFPEFNFLLKERVCPLIIKLFSPNIKYRQGVQNSGTAAATSDKPYFPISMRLLRIVSILIQRYYKILVTECEIFLSLVVKFLDVDKPPWQRALALEVLHKMCIQPELLKSFCQSYDMKPHSTKIFKDIVNALGSYVQSMFIIPSTANPVLPGNMSVGCGAPPSVVQGQSPALLAGMPVGPGITPQAGFLYRGIWLPITPVPSGTCKPVFLDLLDRLEAPAVPEGYGISVAYACLLDVINSIATIICPQKQSSAFLTSETGTTESEETILSQPEKTSLTEQISELSVCDKICDIDCPLELSEQIINSTWCGLLAAFTLLIDASTDETATENILKTMQIYSSICGTLNMTIPRDAFITAMCKASLPPHYTLTVLNTNLLKTDSKGDRIRDCSDASHPGLNCNNLAGASQLPLGLYLGGCDGYEMRQQVVAVGTPLPTASLPLGAQQGPVMLTAKNLQCMRAVLSLAHCHGSVLGTAWHLVLTTLQHLVWILGLKPSTGGSLKASRSNDSANAVITTAVMADLPVLSAMLSRLFESSQYLDEVALHHLIDALCKLSSESMELAYTNREPSLFAVAKLLETGLVNLFRVDVLWRPVTNHLLEVCQHPHIRMREWGAEAVTFLVKAALYHKYEPSLKENKKLQTMLLSPLQELSSISHPDIRQKQLDCALQVLHSSGDIISSGWPQLLDVIGAINEDHGESLIRSAFQCLQLVVADYPPVMPCTCLQLCVDAAAKFGSQTQELNVSLAAIGLLWNIADHLFQNKEKISQNLSSATDEELTSLNSLQISNFGFPLLPFDKLWLSLFCRLGDLCVDSRPAVRKSAGQTLFSTLSAHGSLLQQTTWQVVLWQVLFPLLDRVRSLSGTASTDKITDMGGNILIHHSRNTAQKQWAETQVLSLSGVARIFHTKRDVLQKLGDFPRAWALLLEFIESSSLSKNNEVSFSALKSFQEILNISHYQEPRNGKVKVEPVTQNDEESSLQTEVALWSAAWKVWYNIGIESTKPPPDRLIDNAHAKNDYSMLYVPAQQFLTALIQIFPSLFQHIKERFVASDFQKLATVLQNAVAVPVHGETSPFILPSLTEVVLTTLQDSILQSMNMLLKEALNGNENISSLLPVIFNQLLVFSSYACNAPPYGQLRTRAFVNLKVSGTDWVTMNFVPFGEKALEMVVTAYQQTAQQPNIINSQVLHSIIKALRLPLSMKYACPSQMTWKLAVNAVLKVLQAGLPMARQYPTQFNGMWVDLAYALEDFLFPASLPSPTQSLEDQQNDEALDCKIIHLIRDGILPFANQLPREFIIRIVTLLNKGSIHSATNNSPVDIDSSRKLREEFAKSCFETLLQFSFLESGIEIDDDGVVNLLAVTSLLHRFKEVIHKYAEDERLSGKCPLPRHRMSEISFVLKAVATLAKSLKKADPEKVEWTVWEQLISLYPSLVDCTTSTSAQVCCSLREALHEYADLLEPPKNIINGGS
ncbi:protein MON2 homolog isoform X2 [Parasteatoda tepidariorum]|nr:protein MON2 homolog isoform X1 [Parasteatoda tepidariorum]XP_015915931.1 protein MON2 homolog isoform X1 [Parasteatoda tepidariorum]